MKHLFYVAATALSLAGCAERAAPPLPGNSVSADGSVTLSPPKLSSGVDGARAAEPVGAIEARLFTVDFVMEHQGEIGLDPGQKDAITKEVTRAQADLVKLQWELEAEKERLVKVLDSAKVDEPKASAAAVALMDKENRIKSTHLAMLVRIKNLLTPEQQARLKTLRAEPCAAKDGG